IERIRHEMKRHRRLKPLFLMLLVTGLAAALRLGNLFYQLDSPIFQAPVSDEFEHFALAAKLAAGDWLGTSIGPYHRPQLFAYVCAFFFKIFGTRFAVTHALTMASDIIAIPIWFAVARRAFPRRPAMAGAACIALHWTLVYFSATGYMESFAMLLNAALLLSVANYAINRARGRRQWAWLVTSGFFAGLSILTRPTVILLVPVIGVLIIALDRMRAKKFSAHGIIAAVVFGVITALTMSPNAIRHWAMFHMWAPLGTGSELNFHMSNNRDGWGWERSSPGIEFDVYQMMPVVEGKLTQLSIPTVRNFWKERNATYLREEPGRYVKNLFTKLLQVFNAREIYCTNDFMYAKSRSPILQELPDLSVFAPLALMGVATFTINLVPRFRRDLAASQINQVQLWTTVLLIAWILTYLIGVALFLPIARHRLPAIPPLLLLSGLGISEFFSRLMKGKKVGVLIAAGVAGIILSQLPVVPDWLDKHERWWTQVNLGVALKKLDRPAEAVKELKRGTQIMPEKLETWRQLAIAYEATGDHARAAGSQKQLLILFKKQYPEYYMIEGQVLEDLARYQSLASQHDAAIATARELVALVPDSADAHKTLGTALGVAGNAEESEAELKRAAELIEQ
ncbi:MAG: glycosyltransferase family 39 protein, partial [Candidatus Sumerlaeota bacterium]